MMRCWWSFKEEGGGFGVIRSELVKKENRYNNSMNVNNISYKEVGLDYDICNEIYEDGCGKDIEGRYLDVEFLNIMFEDRLEWEEDELMIENVNRMLEMDLIKSGDVLVLVEF